MKVRLHAAARRELQALPRREQDALEHAMEKLEALGDRLPFPHSSQVKGAGRLRELRPRSGRSPWRGFYRRVGDLLIIAAVGPEAAVDPQGFRRALRAAEERLAVLEQEQ